MNWEKLSKEIEAFDENDLGKGVSDEAIDAASRVLGLPFPPSYREFLRRYGSGGLESEEFFGLGGASHLDVIQRAAKLRAKGLPPHFIPVRGDGFGNYDCLDLRRGAADAPVVEWLHDGGTTQTSRLLGANYCEWFFSILELIRAEE